MVDEYVSSRSWRTKENSNSGYSISGLQAHLSGKIIAEYALRFMYNKKISKAHRNADIHIHDLSHANIGYCSGWSLQDLLILGFNGVPGKISANPAKHYDAILGQMMNFIGTLQNEWAGAQAFNSVDTWLAPFVREDKLTYKEVKQGLQEFVFGINQTSRWGNQVPFSNVTFDWTVPTDMKNEKVIIGGKKLDYTYGDCQKEMDMINKAFIEIMKEGDSKSRIFTFPIPTYNITDTFNWDSKNAKRLFEMTAKYGIPYFQNFIGSDLDPSSVRSMCCRLRLSLKELEKKVGGLFGAGTKTGSVGVVTLNLTKYGYEAKTEKQLFKLIEENMILAKDSLEKKRIVCEDNMKLGLIPYSKYYLKSFRNYFSTIGICGGHECCLNFLGQGIETENGIKLMQDVLNFMRKKLIEFQDETGHLYNLEATPAEGTAYRLARHLRKIYGRKIKLSGTDDIPYLTNSTQLPVNLSIELFDALEQQNKIQPLYTGGTVFHTYLGEHMSDWRSTKNLVKKIAEQTNLPFFSITPTFSICDTHGYIRGEQFRCPECNKATEVYSRVVGYFRPVTNWNKGKRTEYNERKYFKTG